MKYLVITGNPKSDGLCKSIEAAVISGAKDGGAEVDVLSTAAYLRCQVCGDGWGACRDQHKCVLSPKDGFDKALDRIAAADALCIVTPVYWGEMEESLKSFADRARRCEFINGRFKDKPALLAASAGGTGNGIVTCLEQMDRFCRHTGMTIFDYLSINRWNQDYMRAAAHSAAKAMASGRKAGETLQG